MVTRAGVAPIVRIRKAPPPLPLEEFGSRAFLAGSLGQGQAEKVSPFVLNPFTVGKQLNMSNDLISLAW